MCIFHSPYLLQLITHAHGDHHARQSESSKPWLHLDRAQTRNHFECLNLCVQNVAIKEMVNTKWSEVQIQ